MISRLNRIKALLIISSVMCCLPTAVMGDETTDVKAEWEDHIVSLLPLGQKIVSHSPDKDSEQARYEMYMQMLGAQTSAYLGIVQGDPDYPLWTPFIGLFENIMAPNSDTVYMRAPVNPDGVYRLKGDRGEVTILNITVVPDFSKVAEHGILADYDFSTLDADSKGRVEVILSRDRPVGYNGNWWPLDPRARFIMMRSVSEDWGVQREPRIAISRMDILKGKSRDDAQVIRDGLTQIPEWIEKSIITAPEMGGPAHSQDLSDRGFVNKLTLVMFQGGLTNQAYYEGVFDIGMDEALIVETGIPDECRYRSILLADWMYATLDWVNNQSSLNRSQEHIDSDGKLRFVIAQKDPGVANWLDTVGRSRGIIQGRWMGCSTTPLPKVTRVPLASVRDYLPRDTLLVTPEQRSQILRDRRDSAQMRVLW